MSYAQAAARGPKQSPEEARAPAPPQIEQQDISPGYTKDVDSDHVGTVPSTYSGETDTQMQRLEREAEDAAQAAKERFERFEAEASRDYGKGKSAAGKKAMEAKKALGRDYQEVKDNRDNPVVIGNAVVWTVVAAALGFGAYKQHTEGKLNWKVAGAWAGVVGLFGAADYYVSSYLFKNKYPRK